MNEVAENLSGLFPVSDLKIGALRLGGRAFLAPMSGVTDLGMRRLAVRFGAALAVSEMVAADQFARGDAVNRLRAEGAGIDPHVVQIAGCEPYAMAEAARLAQDMGAAMIDINMGCPAKQVTNGYAGSHLMRDLGLAVELIRATIAVASVPVTLKMRLGWDEASMNAAELGKRAEEEGIAMLTVHGRTRRQFYAGKADWAAIRKVKQTVSIPLVANGDCASVADAVSMLALSGADAVMIGRSAVGRPWFVGEVARSLAGNLDGPTPSLAARKEAAIEHYETLLEIFGAEQGLRHARKHLAAYADWSEAAGAHALRRRLVTSDCPKTVKSALGELFDLPRTAEAA